MYRVGLVALLFLTLMPGTGRADGASDVQMLRDLLIERLVLMEQVAAYKWNTQSPIDDPVREANVLKASIARAHAAGLNPSVARRFIAAQMEAAKIIQRYYFATWREEEPVGISAPPDLVTELRPKIGALSVALIAALADQGAELESCSAAKVLRPVPKELEPVPEAWTMAVKGVLDSDAACR
ncbi:MAG: gamma subclass chorismate mutase AroQ [Methyloceanibacter sp.]|nr:gamma subclass chorismate mutase AroQ [Methyloceanibacter sp.]